MNFYEQLFCRGRTTGEGMTHFERLFAAKFGGSPPPEVREYTGAVPVTITADGTPLIDYIISGNTTQNGTPTPENPIMPQGTGERTGNIVNIKNFQDGMHLDMITGLPTPYGGSRIATVQPIDVSQYDNITVAYDEITHSASFMYSIFSGDTLIERVANKKSGDTINTSNATKMYLSLYACTLSDINYIMGNEGSTPLPYEPYGYKIPISSASTTTPVYLGEVETTRKIKKYECTGDESWTVSSGQGKTRAVANFTTSIGIVPLSKVVSTHYIGVEGGAGYPDINTITVNNNGTMIIGISSEYTDVNAFKAYLTQQYAAGTPVTVWYVLANEETAVVNEPLMKIGDYADTLSKAQAGVAIPTNNGSTTVDVDTTVKPSEVYIKYMG